MDYKSLSSNQRFALNVVLPLVYFLPVAVAYFSPKNFGFGYPDLVYIGLGIGGFGAGLWILAMIHLGKSLAVLPGARTLVAKGIYKYLRHPIYAGIGLTLFGLFLACGSVFGMIYLFAVVIPLNLFRAREEEKVLREQFADRYREYRKDTWF